MSLTVKMFGGYDTFRLNLTSCQRPMNLPPWRMTLAAFTLSSLLMAFILPATAQIAWTQGESIITKRSTELRDGPDTHAHTVVQLPAKTTLTRLAERSGPWVQVQTQTTSKTQGIPGWVHMFDVSSPKAIRSGGNIATGAMRNMSSFFNRPEQPGQNTASTPTTAILGVRGLGGYELPRPQPDMAAVDQTALLCTEAQSAATQSPSFNFRGAALIPLLALPLNQIDEPHEIEMGRQLCAVVLGSQPLHPDKALQRYVNQLGRWISQQSTRPDLPWTFAVLDDSSVNALSAPGGYVFVTKGLMDEVTSEAELAGLLAREITHVTEKYHIKALQRGLNTEAMPSTKTEMVRKMYIRGFDSDETSGTARTAAALAARAGFETPDK